MLTVGVDERAGLDEGAKEEATRSSEGDGGSTEKRKRRKMRNSQLEEVKSWGGSSEKPKDKRGHSQNWGRLERLKRSSAGGGSRGGRMKHGKFVEKTEGRT